MALKSKTHALLYQSVLENIKAKLLSGEYSPGSQLPTVNELSEQLQVSPSSVREAYRILESMGVLEVTQGRGTFVSSTIPPNGGVLRQLQTGATTTVADLIEAWRLLKPEVAALAAERATESEVQAIVDVALAEKKLKKPGAEFAKLDYRFDELLFAACHNPVIARILSSFIDAIVECTKEASQVPGHMEKAVNFHNLIATAIRERNPAAARAYMLQHVQDVEADLQKSTRLDH